MMSSRSGGSDNGQRALSADAARFTRLPYGTLRSWVAGRRYPRKKGIGYFPPLIQLPDAEDTRLSFINLIEAFVLRALRMRHSVTIHAVRTAVNYAEQELGIQRLLIGPELKTDGGELFVERYGQLINLSRSGQLAIRHLLEQYLSRIDWEAEIPAMLFPYVLDEEMNGRRPIVIDPQLSFGRPVIRSRSVSTSAVVDRIDAGETVTAIADDYRVTEREIEEAVLYERAA